MTDQPNPYAAPSTVSELPKDDPGGLSDPRLLPAARGLKCIYYGILFTLFAWIAVVPIAWLVPWPSWWTISIQGLGALIGLLMINAGPLFCLTVPRGLALRPFILTTVVFQVIGWAGFAVSLFSLEGTGRWALLLMFVGFVFAAATFLTFLQRLADCIRRPDLVRRARRVGVLGGVVLFALIGLTTVGTLGGATAASVLFFFLVGIGCLLVLVNYANLINALADAIARPLKGK